MVPPYSHGIPRVPRYSGYCQPCSPFAYAAFMLFGVPSHALRLGLQVHVAVRTPRGLLPLVWPLPRSLATTCGISVDFFSSPYLDVSVQAVPLICLWIQHMMTGRYPCRIAPFRNPRLIAYLRLPVAYRSLSRLSSAPSAKASALRPFSLDHRPEAGQLEAAHTSRSWFRLFKSLLHAPVFPVPRSFVLELFVKSFGSLNYITISAICSFFTLQKRIRASKSFTYLYRSFVVQFSRCTGLM